MELHGLHHVTAVTAKAKENLAFYTKVLGLRLVKKSVNQDDVSAYHLFYADKKGTPGTDMTFFDWSTSGPRQGETDGILRTMFRISGENALKYWEERLTKEGVRHNGIQEMGETGAIFFEDFEGQRLALVDDKGAEFHGEVWDGSEVPAEYALKGFFAVQLAIPELLLIDTVLTRVLGFEKQGTYENPERAGEKVVIYAMEGGGPGKEVHVVERQGTKMWALAGGVHHVAFRVKDEGEIRYWWALLNQVMLGNSGLVERYYFKSLYFKISDGILFELATDGPGFESDEPLEHLGEKLALPPFLEPRRAEIEGGLKPL
ncbi:MAG: mhqA [Patescibacteria group bacterium]|nr:mhqA [Patescibacteria group bacterium]